MKDAFLIESSRETDPLTKTLYKSLAASFVNAELISSWIELSLVAINDLGKSIERIPNKQAFNSVKEMSNPKSARIRPAHKIKELKNNKEPR